MSTNNILPTGTIVSPLRSFPPSSKNSVATTDVKSNTKHGSSSHSVSPSYLNDGTNSPITPKSMECAFKLIKRVAEGAYGVIYMAERCRLVRDIDHTPSSIITPNDIEGTGKIIAVKILTGDLSSTGIPVSSIGELDVLARLRHPYLMSMHQISVAEFNAPIQMKNGNIPKTAIAISMPWAQHGNLFNFIEQFKLDFRSMVYVMWQILQGVKYMHVERILHMDLKMENILVLQANPPVIKIADFGMATYTDRKGFREYNQEAITITYRPPELLNYPNIYSTANDIWSVGMIFLYMLLNKPHIYPYIEPIGKVKSFVRKTFNDSVRMRNLDQFLREVNLQSTERSLALNFLNRALSYNPQARPTARELLADPIFKLLVSTNHNHNIGSLSSNNTIKYLPVAPASVSGGTIFRHIWKQPVDKITVESYLAINFLIRLSESFNPKIETFFLAMDLFNRTLAYIYKLREYYKHQAIRWKHGCKIGEVLSLGAMVCLWIAQKAIEDDVSNVEGMYKAANFYYLPEFIIDMERQLIVSLDGIIYQWNPFLNCSTMNDLVHTFDKVTNIFEYQNYTIKNCQIDSNNLPHQLKFKDVYRHTSYYKRESSRPNEIPQIARETFRNDQKIYMNRTKPIICFN